MLTIENLENIKIEGTADENLIQDILEQVYPVWEKYKNQWLMRWKLKDKEYLEKNPHYGGIKKFKFQDLDISIEVTDLGEGFFCTGPWILVKGYNPGCEKILFKIKALIKEI